MKLDKDLGFVDVPFKFAPDIMHVGLHRTGTSYCQKLLFPLLGADVKYFTQSEVKLRGSKAIAKNEQLITIIRQSIKTNRKLLLSQESYLGGLDFSDFANISKLKKIKPDLKIIVTVRSQSHLIPSLYSQKLKAHCYRGSLTEFCQQIIESKKLDYNFLASRLYQSFNHNEVLFICAEDLFTRPAQIFSEISRFIGESGKPQMHFNNADVVVNARPSQSDIMALYLFNLMSRNVSKNSRFAKIFLFLLSRLMRLGTLFFPRLINRVSMSVLSEEILIESYRLSNKKFFLKIKKKCNPHYFS